MKTPFDDMFDYNHDGNLDWLEKGARDAFIMSIIDEEVKENNEREERSSSDSKCRWR